MNPSRQVCEFLAVRRHFLYSFPLRALIYVLERRRETAEDSRSVIVRARIVKRGVPSGITHLVAGYEILIVCICNVYIYQLYARLSRSKLIFVKYVLRASTPDVQELCKCITLILHNTRILYNIIRRQKAVLFLPPPVLYILLYLYLYGIRLHSIHGNSSRSLRNT